MANVERLTKRVKEMEDWLVENKGGPTLDNMNYLITSLHNTTEYAQNTEKQFRALQGLQQEFLSGRELLEQWNEFLKEKEDEHHDTKEQQTEENSVQEKKE